MFRLNWEYIGEGDKRFIRNAFARIQRDRLKIYLAERNIKYYEAAIERIRNDTEFDNDESSRAAIIKGYETKIDLADIQINKLFMAMEDELRKLGKVADQAMAISNSRKTVEMKTSQASRQTGKKIIENLKTKTAKKQAAAATYLDPETIAKIEQAARTPWVLRKLGF